MSNFCRDGLVTPPNSKSSCYSLPVYCSSSSRLGKRKINISNFPPNKQLIFKFSCKLRCLRQRKLLFKISRLMNS